MAVDTLNKNVKPEDLGSAWKADRCLNDISPITSDGPRESSVEQVPTRNLTPTDGMKPSFITSVNDASP